MKGALATRIWVGQLVVLAAAIGTAWLVSGVIGPALFHSHLLAAGHQLDAAGMEHVELGYAEANRAALGLGLAVAATVALGVTWMLWRRLARPLASLTGAATEMARGHYEVRVPAQHAGAEFDSLATAFNDLADRLEHVEDTRRRLLSDLAHELRTPIATLSGYLDGLEDGVVVWDDTTRALLVDQVARLSRLAGDLAEVSRAEEGRMSLSLRRIGVDELLERAVGAARAAYGLKGVGLDLQSRSGPVQVCADPDRIAQVLANLLGNALRHSPTGSRVTVGSALEGAEVLVEIRDQGDGIAAEHLPHIFERFYRVDRARRRGEAGAGIGLTISKALVNAHGGSLSAASPGVGQGATFVVRLPLDGRGQLVFGAPGRA